MRIVLFLLSLLSISFSIYALPTVIYDHDNVIDRMNHSSEAYKEVARSTVALFQKTDFKETEEGFFFLPKRKIQTIGELYNLCPDEKFFHEPAASGCSGTLVGEDLVLTASHCLVGSSTCEEYVAVFDYTYNENTDDKTNKEEVLKFSAAQIYKCKEVLDRKYEYWEGPIDYALVRLERAVEDRKAIPYRKEGIAPIGTEVFVVGHPLGSPSKIADNALVMGRETDYDFQANLDAFPGNSGSGVFNTNTLELEGILHGVTQDDFVTFSGESCKRLNIRKTSDNFFFFTTVSKVTNVEYFKNNL